MSNNSNSLIHLLFAMLLVLSGCCCGDNVDCDKCPEHIDCLVVPPDNPPVSTVLLPSNIKMLKFRGDLAEINFRLDDDWQLDTFWLTETWTSVDGTSYGPQDSVIAQKVLHATNWIEEITYTVPPSKVQYYSTITLTGYVRDNKGQQASASVFINVLPDLGTGEPYDTTVYSGCNDTIYSILTGQNYNFYFLGRTNKETNPLNFDLGESSSGSFQAILTTPNQPGIDSTIVMTNSLAFNYDSLTWTTTWQAYVTSNQIDDRSQPLSVGDIVIVKRATASQFAILRICELFPGPGTAWIRFEYKYTHEF